MGFDETFKRTWEYYLAYSEAGFRTGYINVSQFQLSRPAPGPQRTTPNAMTSASSTL
jgi:cyclopropane-fatty-acyl-phospholipid synthase